MADDLPPSEAGESADLTLGITGVGGSPGPVDGSVALAIETTRGRIEGVFHPVEGGTGAVICVGGALGGLDGPADKLYARLPELLKESAVTVLRLQYRLPNNLEECALDVLAGCSFLRGIGASDLVLVGHSFGGAVVIKAGALFPIVRGVVAMSPQLHGTRMVHEMRVPLLLIHGAADGILSHEASEDIYRRAHDPRRIVLFADTGHSLAGVEGRIDTILAEWIPARLDDRPMESGRSEYIPD